jgi:hypothetical protein
VIVLCKVQEVCAETLPKMTNARHKCNCLKIAALAVTMSDALGNAHAGHPIAGQAAAAGNSVAFQFASASHPADPIA